MNIKLQLGEVRLLIDKRFPIEQISNQLQPIAKQANLIFAEHQVGAGYLQWALPGSDWTAFSKGNEDEKNTIAQLFKERKAQMQGLLQGASIQDAIFSVPSENFIFFRQKGEQWEIALTAWGYKYTNKPFTSELDTWITRQDLQKVNIAFAWAGQNLPAYSFKLSGHTRTTSLDGFMYVDGALPVGSSYSIETLQGQCYTLTVEKGKSDYIFDLTQYCQIEITVYQDGNPLPDYTSEVVFGSNRTTLVTDMTGHSQIRLPLLNDALGQIVTPQPTCIVACGVESQQQIPSKNGDVLSFVFNFRTGIPEPPIPEPPVPSERFVRIKVEVFKDVKPVANQTCKILYDGDTHIVTTDKNGEAFFNLPVKDAASDLLQETQTMCEVVCEDAHQSKTLEENTANLTFHFDLPKEEKPQDPEYVYVQLKDYAGVPLVDMPFQLTTKKKGRVQLQTDHEGNCEVPKDWFTPKEKMKIEFRVSAEYQETHDIHDTKKNNRK